MTPAQVREAQAAAEAWGLLMRLFHGQRRRFMAIAQEFELAQAWQLISDEIEQRRTPLRARALASPDVVPMCRWILGNRVRIGPAGADGRVEIELRGHHVESLAGEIAGLGAALEVVDPPELRDRLARVGAELTATYRRR